MGQAVAFHDVTAPIDSRSMAKDAVRHGRGLARVPTLNWPVDLFSDNATITELMSEDWARDGDLFILAQDLGIFGQVAA